MYFELFGTEVLSWQIFASLGVLLMALEIVVSGFIMLPIGLACLITAVSTIFVESPTGQLAVFGISLIAVFFGIQKWVKSHPQTDLKSNVDSMKGKTVEVIKPVTKLRSGYVKLYGDSWQALTNENCEFVVGSRAIIASVDGNKVIIKKEQ